MKLDLYLTPYTKINSKWTQGIKVKIKTIKLFERKMGINLCDIELGSGFLDMITKAQTTKRRK